MKVTWGVCVFCRYERGILLGLNNQLNRWEALSGKIQRGETPLAAANRVVQHHTKQQPIFPVIHHVAGAPAGLLYYTEYGLGPDELRMAFVFLAKMGTGDISPQDSKQYERFMWINRVGDVPQGSKGASMPYVLGALPLALMALNLEGGVRL